MLVQKYVKLFLEGPTFYDNQSFFSIKVTYKKKKLLRIRTSSWKNQLKDKDKFR
jgi:hypothetical protein